MNRYRSGVLLGLFLLIFSRGEVFAGGASKDILNTAATASTNGSNPTTSGSNLVYAYTLGCNSSLSDTLHVQLTMINDNGVGSQSYTVTFDDAGSPQIVATLPASFSLADDGVAVTKDIPIAANNLAPGDYTLNINIGGFSSSDVTQSNPKSIQVMIHVNDCESSAPSCFFTSSGGEFLSECSGQLVSTNTGGTFKLVNKKNGVITATSPGQFYYNYLWTNTGPAVDVEVQLGGLQNLVPHGANAVHAYTFDTSGFTQNVDAFNMVNHDGTPCGPSGPCTVSVGAGETLWVTWHLEYSGVGSSRPGAGNACEVANEPIGAAAFLVDANDHTTVIAGECSTSASGYNKR